MTDLDFHFLFFPVLRSGVVSQARGSAYIEMQRTKVTCAVYPYAELSQGPRSTFSSGGAKEECVKEIFWGGAGGGGMLVDFYSISLK